MSNSWSVKKQIMGYLCVRLDHVILMNLSFSPYLLWSAKYTSFSRFLHTLLHAPETRFRHHNIRVEYGTDGKDGISVRVTLHRV